MLQIYVLLERKLEVQRNTSLMTGDIDVEREVEIMKQMCMKQVEDSNSSRSLVH